VLVRSEFLLCVSLNCRSTAWHFTSQQLTAAAATRTTTTTTKGSKIIHNIRLQAVPHHSYTAAQRRPAPPAMQYLVPTSPALRPDCAPESRRYQLLHDGRWRPPPNSSEFSSTLKKSVLKVSVTYRMRCSDDKWIIKLQLKNNRLLVIRGEGIEGNNVKIDCRKPLKIRTYNKQLTVFNNFNVVIKLFSRFSFGLFRFHIKTAHILPRYLWRFFSVLTGLVGSLKEVTTDYFNITCKSSWSGTFKLWCCEYPCKTSQVVQVLSSAIYWTPSIIVSRAAVFIGLLSYHSGAVSVETKCKTKKRNTILIKFHSLSDSTWRWGDPYIKVAKYGKQRNRTY